MNGKKSFIAYKNWGEVFSELNNQQAGKLIKAIFDYQNGKEYKLDKTLSLVFISFKQTLDRDNEKYDAICERNKNNGKKGGRPSSKKKPTKPTGLFGNPKKPKKPDNDSDNDNDSENDSHNKKEILKKKNTHPSEQVTDDHIKSISEKYQVPEAFVKSKFDDVINWYEEKPNDKTRKGRDWVATLRNWVKRDAVKIGKEVQREASWRNKNRAIDATNL